MRHGDKINNLSRTASHRKALLSNLAIQLITHKKDRHYVGQGQVIEDLCGAADH